MKNTLSKRGIKGCKKYHRSFMDKRYPKACFENRRILNQLSHQKWPAQKYQNRLKSVFFSERSEGEARVVVSGIGLAKKKNWTKKKGTTTSTSSSSSTTNFVPGQTFLFFTKLLDFIQHLYALNRSLTFPWYIPWKNIS